MTSDTMRLTSDEINCLIFSYLRDSGFNHTAFNFRNEAQLQNSPLFAKHVPRGELVEILVKALEYIKIENHWPMDAITMNCTADFSLLEPHVCSPSPIIANTLSSFGSDSANTVILPTEDCAEALTGGEEPTRQAQSDENAMLPHDDAEQQTLMGSKAIVKSELYGTTIYNDAVLVKEKTPPQTSHARNAQCDHVSASSAKRKASPPFADSHIEKRARLSDIDVDSAPEGSYFSSSRINDSPIFVPEGKGKISGGTNVKKIKHKHKGRAQGPADSETNRKAIMLLPGHTYEVFVCAWNPALPGLLATGSKDAVVHLWTCPDPPKTINEFAEFPERPIKIENFSKAEQGDLTSLHWNSDGSLLAIGSYDSILRICTSTGALHFSHSQHQGPIFAVRFSKSGRWLLTASLDGTTCLWDVKEKRLERQYRCHTDFCLDVDWLSETVFATAGADQKIHIMRIDEPDPIRTLSGHKHEVNQIKANITGTRLASCSDDKTSRIWHVNHVSNPSSMIPGLSATEHVVVLEGHKHRVSTIAWCPYTPPGENELICSTSFDGTARLWDSVTGECLKIFTDHRRPVYASTFSPDGQFVGTGSGDGWLHIYDVWAREKRWSWYAGSEKPGVFEIDWQMANGVNRIALALECRSVAVIDVSKIPALGRPVQP